MVSSSAAKNPFYVLILFLLTRIHFHIPFQLLLDLGVHQTSPSSSILLPFLLYLFPIVYSSFHLSGKKSVLKYTLFYLTISTPFYLTTYFYLGVGDLLYLVPFTLFSFIPGGTLSSPILYTCHLILFSPSSISCKLQFDPLIY